MKNISIYIIFLIFSFNVYALDVNKTIKSTVENNIKVKIALEKINEAKELISSSYGGYRPDISIKLIEEKSSTETTTASTTTTTDKLSDSVSLKITQNLYNGNRTSLDLEKSKILFNKEVENFYLTLNDLTLKAIEGYLTVQMYEKSLTVTEKNYEILKKIYEDTLNKKNLGVSTLSDLKYAESSYLVAKSNLLISQGDLNIGKKTFKQIVGLEPINLETVVNINKDINFNNVLKNASKFNHELNILNFDYEVSLIDLQIQKNIKLPSLDLTGDVSYKDDVAAKGTESTSGSISATLSIPIYQKGIENSDIRKYQSKLLQSEYIINDKKESIELDTSILINNYKIYQSQLESSLVQIEANKILLDVLTKEYESGIKTFTDLIDQEEQLLEAYLYNFSKNKDLLITYFQILAIEGKLVEVFKDYLPKL